MSKLTNYCKETVVVYKSCMENAFEVDKSE